MAGVVGTKVKVGSDGILFLSRRQGWRSVVVAVLAVCRVL